MLREIFDSTLIRKEACDATNVFLRKAWKEARQSRVSIERAVKGCR